MTSPIPRTAYILALAATRHVTPPSPEYAKHIKRWEEAMESGDFKAAYADANAAYYAANAAHAYAAHAARATHAADAAHAAYAAYAADAADAAHAAYAACAAHAANAAYHAAHAACAARYAKQILPEHIYNALVALNP